MSENKAQVRIDALEKSDKHINKAVDAIAKAQEALRAVGEYGLAFRLNNANAECIYTLTQAERRRELLAKGEAVSASVQINNEAEDGATDASAEGANAAEAPAADAAATETAAGEGEPAEAPAAV